MFTFNATPSTNSAENVQDSQSDTRDTNFGGHREVSSVSDSKDYTKRTGGAQSIEENPINETTKDIDDLEDISVRKREFSRRDETSDTQKSNEADFITKSDTNNLPLEDTKAVEPGSKYIGSKIINHFGNGQYDNNPNRGYEGELR